MNRAVAIIFGVFLFFMGLFLGMVGSFFQALPSDWSRHAATASRSANTVPHKTVSLPKQPATKQSAATWEEPSESMESALVDALRTLAVALASQPAPSPAAPATPPETEPEPDLATATAEEPRAIALTTAPPEPITPESPPPPATAGHWAYDNQVGWLWMPDGALPYVFVPAVEVYPGGYVTVRPGNRRGAAAPRSNASVRRTTPSSRVIDPIIPGTSRAPAWSPFSNSMKSRNPAASQKPQSSVIEPRTSGNTRMPAWFQETRK